MGSALFDKVLVANRGEIAVRIIGTLRRLGIGSVVVCSEADADSLHVELADEAVLIGPAPVSDSYLRIDKVIDAAVRTGAQAIHPGYGLLAENADFATACADAGLVFIGPPAEAISAMGSKVQARRIMSAAGVPVVPGSLDNASDLDRARQTADEIGYPVAVKAAGGGGGKGFRVAHHPQDLASALEGASAEGQRFFGDPSVYLERYLHNPRHVEVQVLADQHGNTVHLFERDCSVQRRHQKLIEEAPAPSIPDELREHIGAIAVTAAQSVGYTSAGTVEGLLHDGQFFFLEMNTRIQVEHTVTEMVTDLDLVEQQLRIAAGEPLPFTQADLTIHGHAIECRINAEDATRNFLPSPGRITAYTEPQGPGIRIDSGVTTGAMVHPHYDPMIAKLVAWGETREEATERMLTALDGFTVAGVRTLIPFHRALLSSSQWSKGETCADLVTDRSWLKTTGGDG
ncbi:acetyl/propionyl/methylcrotonyl-CoA carboxylase subunit alpha [Rhodococcus wratislaviensis]|uniref:acetyl-CoA carboxylase biotin carboxylase subunit n=1 Tax=Rhodococcus wratislaviensis TaxID=44752 RepID=UPI0035166371